MLANAPDAVKKLNVSQNRDVSLMAPRVVQNLTVEPVQPKWTLGPFSITRPF